MAVSDYTFQVTAANFEEQVLQAELPVLVDFWAEWCPPCLMIAPLVDELAKKYQGQMLVGKADVDEYTQITELYDVYGFPTLILFKNGEPIHRIVGFKTRDRLEAELVPFLQPVLSLNK